MRNDMLLMRSTTRPWLVFLTAALLVGAAGAASAAPHTLWYPRPATKWVEALPVGNGRLGAMVSGGAEDEHLHVNKDTLWTGRPHEYQHRGAAEYLPTSRRLLAEGKQREAEALALEHFMSEPLRQKVYQPFGDLRLHFA